MSRKKPSTAKPVLRGAEFWTPEEDAVLRAGVEKRVTYRCIGNEIGRTPEACRDRVKRLGLIREPSKRRRSSSRRSGLSLPQVAGDGPISAPQPFVNLEACSRAHLADLLREYGEGQNLGYAKAVYRARCEVPLTREAPFRAPTTGYLYSGSGCSSPAGLCGEGM